MNNRFVAELAGIISAEKNRGTFQIEVDTAGITGADSSLRIDHSDVEECDV